MTRSESSLLYLSPADVRRALPMADAIEAIVCRARVVVDDRVAALEEAGDLLMPLREGRITAEHVRADLGELIANRAAGRQTRDEVTLFKSVGLAVQDLFAASRALENARRLGIGTALM
jgi:ornithine cyclodeaminase/alanine dehydrogenase-like protein (mu-crystallin family)